MIKSDIKDLAFGIVLILVGIFAIFYCNCSEPPRVQ